MLFFKVGPSPSEWWGEMLVSYDRGRTLSIAAACPKALTVQCCSQFCLDDHRAIVWFVDRVGWLAGPF
ncbi:MAG: hypothetical protein R3C56_42865 [Pirellulaceae bacterium]